jgi:AcrR family transcriptional regulator
VLEAAGEVFAEKGFHNATVRDICERAEANIAAVNYHFQTKEQLYAAVLAFAQQRALEKYPPTLGLSPNATPKQRLHAFVRAFLLRIFDKGQYAWHGKLMAREMVDPSAALDNLAEQFVKPQSQVIAAIVKDILGERATPDRIMRCTFSVVGQVLFYHNCRPVICRIFPHQGYEPADIEQIAAHITEFSYAAIQNIGEESISGAGATRMKP